MLSRLLLSAADDAVKAATAADDVDNTADAATAVDASALPPPDAPDGGGFTMAWVIALPAPLIALILSILVGKQHFAARWGTIGWEG